MAGKGSCRLSKGCYAIIGKIFKVHGDCATGDGKSTEAVDGCLYKNICKAEYCALQGGRDADREDFFNIFWLYIREK